MTKTALVTGTSTGIGRACALRLARNGFHVFASVRRAEDGEALQAHSDGEISPLIFDITDDEARRIGVETVRRYVGQQGLDALVNNAGAGSAGPLEFVPLSNIRQYIEINLIGAIALTQECLPLLRQSRGRIINIGSAQDLLTPPYFGGYTIAKWGMRGFHQALRLELRPSGIECVLIVPGAVKTAIWKDVPNYRKNLDLLSERAGDLYGNLAVAMQNAAKSLSERGLEPDAVAREVERAIAARRPKPEVIVGADARFLMRPIGALPTRLREYIVSRIFKLP